MAREQAWTKPPYRLPTDEEIARHKRQFLRREARMLKESPFLQVTDEELAHLVKVGSVKPWADEVTGCRVIDVRLPKDPKYGHVLLPHYEYKCYLLIGEIAFDEDGYPMYIGRSRLRGK
jgi:hypothetical protein